MPAWLARRRNMACAAQPRLVSDLASHGVRITCLPCGFSLIMYGSSSGLYTCFVDLQKAYDSVQHDVLWARLRHIGISPRMLAAIQSLYVSGALSMKINDQPCNTWGRVRAAPSVLPSSVSSSTGCMTVCRPLLPLLGCSSGLGAGFLHWFMPMMWFCSHSRLGGLQQLIDGMQGFCASMGLTISPTGTVTVPRLGKTEVVVFSRTSLSPISRGMLVPSSCLCQLASSILV